MGVNLLDAVVAKRLYGGAVNFQAKLGRRVAAAGIALAFPDASQDKGEGNCGVFIGAIGTGTIHKPGHWEGKLPRHDARAIGANRCSTRAAWSAS